MRVLNIGSINIDHVYEVAHFVCAGETLGGQGYRTFAGGKGFNQSIALSRAGISTRHAGKVGKDAAWLLRRLEEEGVDTRYVAVGDYATGHAIIQVVPDGENAIVLYGGANQRMTAADIEAALASCAPGDCLLLQNETNLVPQAIREAHARGLRVVFNPAPMDPAVHQYPLELVDLFVVNETEARELTARTAPEDIVANMRTRFPGSATVWTRGSEGAIYFDARTWLHEPARRVEVVDTTAAGDTFIGFFLAALLRTQDPAFALAQGCRAAAICVTRAGASDAIPLLSELDGVEAVTPDTRL